MKKFLSIICLIAFGVTGYANLQAEATAPHFELENSLGKKVSLSDYLGKYVVLEWTNFDCPFVEYHYHSHNMQNLQKEWREKGVVWFSIISSAPGKAGYLTPADAEAKKKEVGSEATMLLLDPTGEVGRRYAAKTTPHMYIINSEGHLIYQGALDDHPGRIGEPFKPAHNYVSQALHEALEGKPISHPDTKPYGCSVKY